MEAISRGKLREQPYWLGFLYFGLAFFTDSLVSLSAGGTKYLHLHLPADGRLVHVTELSIAKLGDPQVTVTPIQNPDFTQGTTTENTLNFDDRFTKSSDAQLYTDSTYTSGGKEYPDIILPSGTNKTGKLLSESTFERVHKAGDDYFYRFVNNSGSTPVDLQFKLYWYESGN